MNTTLKIIDPINVPQEDLPLIVLSDNLHSLLSWGIKAHTSGNYSHIMIMRNPGFVVTQNWSYREISIASYLKSKYHLKFWQYNLMSKDNKDKINQMIDDDLKASWWRKSYDFLGLVGQLFNIQEINNPWKSYCSERSANYLRSIPTLKTKIPLHPAPSDLDRIFRKINGFNVYGYWMET